MKMEGQIYGGQKSITKVSELETHTPSQSIAKKFNLRNLVQEILTTMIRKYDESKKLYKEMAFFQRSKMAYNIKWLS